MNNPTSNNEYKQRKSAEKKITKNFFFLPQRTSQNWTEGREQRRKFVLSFNNMDNTKMENGNGQC